MSPYIGYSSSYPTDIKHIEKEIFMQTKYSSPSSSETEAVEVDVVTDPLTLAEIFKLNVKAPQKHFPAKYENPTYVAPSYTEGLTRLLWVAPTPEELEEHKKKFNTEQTALVQANTQARHTAKAAYRTQRDAYNRAVEDLEAIQTKLTALPVEANTFTENLMLNTFNHCREEMKYVKTMASVSAFLEQYSWVAGTQAYCVDEKEQPVDDLIYCPVFVSDTEAEVAAEVGLKKVSESKDACEEAIAEEGIAEEGIAQAVVPVPAAILHMALRDSSSTVAANEEPKQNKKKTKNRRAKK